MGFKYLPAFVCTTWKQPVCIRKRKIKMLGLWTQTRGGMYCSVAEEVTHEVSRLGGQLGPSFLCSAADLCGWQLNACCLRGNAAHLGCRVCVWGLVVLGEAGIYVCFSGKVWVLYESWYYYWPSLISSLNCHQFKLFNMFNRVIYLKENW